MLLRHRHRRCGGTGASRGVPVLRPKASPGGEVAKIYLRFQLVKILERERPRLPLTRELAPQATEGEKCSSTVSPKSVSFRLRRSRMEESWHHRYPAVPTGASRAVEGAGLYTLPSDDIAA